LYKLFCQKSFYFLRIIERKNTELSIKNSDKINKVNKDNFTFFFTLSFLFFHFLSEGSIFLIGRVLSYSVTNNKAICEAIFNPLL